LNTNESAKHKSETGPFPSCLAGGHPAALRDFWSDILLGSAWPKIALSDAMSIGFYPILRICGRLPQRNPRGRSPLGIGLSLPGAEVSIFDERLRCDAVSLLGENKHQWLI
jgi:hypothetical protein